MKYTNVCQTARGAILLFLLLQLTNPRTQGKIGVLNPFTEYVRYLPKQTLLPTFWSDAEKSLLIGTSLEAALESKLKNLSDDFDLIRARTTSIAWCRQYWWDADCVTRTFSDWKRADALYRSRALDLPGTGHAVVPCIDMANHASGDETTAFYATASDGIAVLRLRPGKKVYPGDEITISYGDEKGACEMLYSYGFIEDTMISAKELYLELDIPDDDPLGKLKRQVAKVPPGFRLYLQTQDDRTGWEGAFVWLCCINEEDGLEFKELQDNNGERELQASWKDQDISDFESFQETLKNEPTWDIYQLRATVLLYERVTQQLLRLESSEKYVQELWESEDLDDHVYDKAMKLRDLEQSLLLQAFEEFDTKVRYSYLLELKIDGITRTNVTASRNFNYRNLPWSKGI